jgi:hypothetical protein
MFEVYVLRKTRSFTCLRHNPRRCNADTFLWVTLSKGTQILFRELEATTPGLGVVRVVDTIEETCMDLHSHLARPTPEAGVD